MLVNTKNCLCILIIFVVNVYSMDDVLKGQSVIYGIASLTEGVTNSSLCYRELNSLYNSINHRTVWALKALDASGRPGPGFLYGNNLWLGSHTHCSDISNRKRFEINYDKISTRLPEDEDYPPYEMAFVMALANHNNTLQIHTQLPLENLVQIGLCVPKSCADELSELQALIEKYFKGNYLKSQQLFGIHLELSDIKPLDDDGFFMFKLPKFMVLMCIVTIVIILTVVGTVYDVRQHKREKHKNLIVGHNETISSKFGPNSVSEAKLVSTPSTESRSTIGEVLKCFSIYSNTKALVKTKMSPDAVGCIHGLRFFGMMWVIMIHSVFYQADYISNVPYAYRLSEDMGAQILSNSTYSVDTYLFLSGFLLSYLFFKSKTSHASEKENKPVNYMRKLSQFVMMCLHRFLRLTPPYVVTIIMSDVLWSYYRKTSSLQSSEYPDELCSKYWWRNILYINNLYPRSEMCLSWSWYLSLDTQFFTIGAFLLILSTIAFKIAAAGTILLIVVNIIATAYKSYSIGYIPTMDEQLAQLDAIYDLPWNRFGPYFVGVITGYILLVKLKKTLHLKERTRILLWIVFPMINLWILFTLYSRNLSVEFSAAYMGISRTLWGVGLAWLMIACCTGNAPALEKFLSFRGWIPLSRLTYCAYLLNPVVANIVYLGSESSFTSSKASFALTVLGITSMTFHLAYMYSMLFESPFILLTKMFFNKLKPRNHNTSADNASTSTSTENIRKESA